jgi:gluconolactonase
MLAGENKSGSGFERIASDVTGAEGPAFDRDGRFFCVAPDKGHVLRLDGGHLVELANTGGIPAGLALGPDGWIWIADMSLGILRVSPEEGVVEDVVRLYEGKPIRGCNDLAFDSKGNLYFSAPAGSWETPVGELFCRRSDGEVARIDDGYGFCNGVAVSADSAVLIVAETRSKHLWAYDLDGRGRAGNRRLFGTVPGDHVGGPDGIDFDSEGNLLVANWGGGSIDVFGAQGGLTERFFTPFDKPSNLEIRPGTNELWVTEHTHMGVWKMTWKHLAAAAKWGIR